jgi:hypothetical protein
MIGSTTGATKWVRSVQRVCVVACAVGGIALFTTHCSSPAATPQAFVNAQLEEGPNSTEPCAFAGASVVNVGTSDDKEDGGSAKNGMDGLAFSCTVSSSGNGFTVQASVMNSTQAFTIQTPPNGVITAPVKGVGGGGMVLAGFSNTNDGSYSSGGATCTVTFTQISGEALGMGIMSGAVWANVNCPTLTLFGGQPSICSGIAEIKFENCGQ